MNLKSSKMYSDEIKIPEERVAVLIGKKGKIKRDIEKRTKTKLDVSSDGGVVIKSEDSVDILISKNIIKAIGRGFNPKVAFELLNEDNCLEFLDISKYGKGRKKDLLRIRARAIGKEGKARKFIESLTNTSVCVYGKTVGIIGEVNKVIIAKRALENLLNGAPHGNVYRFIEIEMGKLNANIY